jgi:hypothetical protein
VPLGVIARFRGVAPHDGDELGSLSFLKTGPALDLGDVAAADDPPPNWPAYSVSLPVFCPGLLIHTVLMLRNSRIP